MAEKPKKRRGRRAYLEDYQILANGKYAYTGTVYRYTGAKDWSKLYYFLWFFAGTAGLCVLVSGLLPVSGLLNTFYVLIPWILAFTGVGSLIWALCRMVQTGGELKEYIYKATILALPRRAVFAAVCCCAAALAQLVKLLLDGLGPGPAADICFPVLMLLAAALSLLLRRQVKALPFEAGR